MNIVLLVAALLVLALAAAISRIAQDVRKIRRHFDGIDKAKALERAGMLVATAAGSIATGDLVVRDPRPTFVPPPIRTPDTVR